ncbi:MAG: AmmeMemoRadiSam system radical SAM enzyme [Spirochaetaceae bacterium]|jgi:pyruvate formate lyase activating enzyme|nr:AmmeMemoRadiSam system radical SAM enzyme [Spirochaetaceae bacterium]
MNDVSCGLCPGGCILSEGQCGFCGARANAGGKIECINYEYITSIALDPVEKKPLNRYKSGSFVLSAGSFGCNFRCPFCQNHDISMARPRNVSELNTFIKEQNIGRMSKEELALKAQAYIPAGNIGIAFTYNEPLTGFEFVYDTALYFKAHKMDTVLVSNGCINPEYFNKLVPYIDAMNIDLKTFNPEIYQKYSGIKNALSIVKNNISYAASRCHVELTCLIIPGENDSEAEMEQMCTWIASVSPEIPLHITRFFPRYKYADRTPTPPETLRRLRGIALSHLKYVYLGNI